MGTVAIEVWQFAAALVVAGVSGWIAKRFSGGTPKAGGQDQPNPANPAPSATPLLSGPLPAWTDFAAKLLAKLQSSLGADQNHPIIQAVRSTIHDEVLARSGLPIQVVQAITNPLPPEPLKKG